MLRTITVLCLAGLFSLACFAQGDDASASRKKPATSQTTASTTKQFYHLNFVVQELENDRVINSRSYSMIIRDTGQSSIRAEEKVPYVSNPGGKPDWPQYQQIAVGVNIDCYELEVTPGGVSLRVKAEISSVMGTHGADGPPASVPIIRHNQWDSYVTLPLKQPTVLFSSDDPASKRTMQLKLTVTPVR